MPPPKHTYEKYVKEARKLGADDAKVISTHTVVTAPWVRVKCQYGCPVYGKRLTCPPHSPTPEETDNIVRSYRTAILLHGDDHKDLTRIACDLEQKVFLDGYYKAFSMGSGPCRLCEKCNVDEGKCNDAWNARPAMEACGIDVFQTARNNGFPLEVAKSSRSRTDYYGIVLVE
jgi:predicted metal-binding protein